MHLALFDLDHTLLPIDSDYEWGQFLCRHGIVDAEQFGRRNADFFTQYQAGTLDPVEYLEFALGTLAAIPPQQLQALREQYMEEVIRPVLHPAATRLLRQHQEKGDLTAIITATNRFVTEPIAAALGVPHLLAAEPERDASGNITGKLSGVPTSGKGKVTHLHHWLAAQNKQLSDFASSHFYSDSHNDIPLLDVVTHPVATNPNAKLQQYAAAKGWPQITLFEKQ